MSLVMADRVKEITFTTGTGPLTLGGSPSSFQPFTGVCVNGDTVDYCIAHRSANEWEVGRGSWGTGGILTRTTVRTSSNAGALVSLSAGTKDVFICTPAPSTVVAHEEVLVEVTESQIRTIQSVPITMVAGDSAYLALPTVMNFEKPDGSAFTAGALTRINVSITGGALVGSSTNANIITSAPPQYAFSGRLNWNGTSEVPQELFVTANWGNAIILQGLGGNPSGGSGSLWVHVAYDLWPKSFR